MQFMFEGTVHRSRSRGKCESADSRDEIVIVMPL